LNPGKLATPSRSDDKLVSIHATKRGKFDRQIPEVVRSKFEKSIHCNGNGACFDYNPDSVMCPSSKVTGDRIHSPKGRAGILREWLRLTSQKGHSAGVRGEDNPGSMPVLLHGRGANEADFSHEVYDAMNGCLACKACATQCPVKVDIPAMRSEFLEQYHTRYRRPLKDYFVAVLETALRVLVLWPKMSNWLMSTRPIEWVLRIWVGIVDSPSLAEQTLRSGLRLRKAIAFDLAKLKTSTPEEMARTVLVAQDAFTTFYEPKVALATYDLLTRLGRRVVVLPYRENGKALHVKGFLGMFRRVARSNARFYSEVARLGVPIVGIEPAVTLTYRDEYRHELEGEELGFSVSLLQEYLVAHFDEFSERIEEGVRPSTSEPYRLFGHCTERTYEPRSQEMWKEVFARFGTPLSLEKTGCCGMCGVFGHESEHLKESLGVFELSWKRHLPTKEDQRGRVIATGHSCRSQVKRVEGYMPRHPVEILLELLPA
jgi:Fe-S oxidoreductase